MQMKLIKLRQEKFDLKNENEQKLNDLIRKNETTITQYTQDKSKCYGKILSTDQLIKYDIENFKTNQNQQIEIMNNLHKSNVESIHSSYRDKIEKIKHKFCQVKYSLVCSFTKYMNE